MSPDTETASPPTPFPTPLPWPPPGLEAMRGCAGVLARTLGMASIVTLASLVQFTMIRGDGSRVRGGSGPALFALGLAIVGAFLQFRAAYAVWRIMSQGGMTAWRGYSWLTIGEVLSDSAGDTGDLISGRGEFASLSPETRSTMRVFRMLGALGRVIAGVLPLPAFFFAAAFGVSGAIGPAITVMMTLGPSVALLVLAGLARRMESIALRPARDEAAKQFERRTSAIKIADKWYASFEEARAGHGPGRGRPGGVLRAWIAGGVGAALIIGLGSLMFPLIALAGFGAIGMYDQSGMFPADRTGLRTSSQAHLRRFDFDSTISAERAGDAFHSISEFGQTRRPAIVKPPVRTYPPWPDYNKDLFPTRQSQGWTGPRSPDVLDFAKKGLTAEQRAYLVKLAAHPLWEDFTLVARTPRADIAGGTFITPFPPTTSISELSDVRFASREIANANTSRAALFLADGRRDQAERVIRETIAYGFRISDDGNAPIDATIGAVVVGIGEAALERLRKLTGDTSRTSAIARPTPPPINAPILAVQRAASASSGYARTSPRGVRIETVMQTQIALCGTVSGLLFGQSPVVERQVALTRESAARTPAEKAVFDLYANLVDRTVPAGGFEPRRLSSKLFRMSARITSSMLGNPRIRNCAELERLY